MRVKLDQKTDDLVGTQRGRLEELYIRKSFHNRIENCAADQVVVGIVRSKQFSDLLRDLL
ncbi:hypothetical protein ASD38_20650 [Caulobacter sp. Root487D2Y]|nr:hypothetical protein ASD38_20650 [Caulobacter sp. Root487D2Y]